MAQVYEGLKDGDFPVRWGSGWARYGWPAPLFAQQTTSYVGAIVNFVVNDIVTAYNVTVFLGALVSTFLLYIFLRFYVGFVPALLGAFVFHFAPYRIMNIYTRGAIPEFFASIFIIAILIALYLALEKKRLSGYLLVACSVAGLLLTHPFMVVVGSFIFVPYGIYLLWLDRNYVILKLITICLMLGIGIGLAAYFLVPLFLEVKYLYYGGSLSHFTPGHFLSIERFFIDSWPYFTADDIAPRGHFHIGGILEGVIIVMSFVYVLYRYVRHKTIEILPLLFSLVGTIYILMTLPISDLLYQKIILLGNIQHPWRMLTGYILVPPILLAFLLEKTGYKRMISILIIFIIASLRFPELYGKNYTAYPEQSYFVTDDNMHGTNMNTIWMGEVRDYPYQREKVVIVEGEGTISELQLENSQRRFVLTSENVVNIVDYTFYFPGWKTYVDGQEVPIQFQDPAYRGVITYQVPAGEHEITEVFTRTKPRLLGDVISGISLIFFAVLFTLRERISQIIPYVQK